MSVIFFIPYVFFTVCLYTSLCKRNFPFFHVVYTGTNEISTKCAKFMTQKRPYFETENQCLWDFPPAFNPSIFRYFYLKLQRNIDPNSADSPEVAVFGPFLSWIARIGAVSLQSRLPSRRYRTLPGPRTGVWACLVVGGVDLLGDFTSFLWRDDALRIERSVLCTVMTTRRETKTKWQPV